MTTDSDRKRSTTQYLTIPQAAEIMACSASHVQALLVAGKLAGYSVGLGGRKRWRTSQQAIDDFMAANSNVVQARPERRRKGIGLSGTKLDQLG